MRCETKDCGVELTPKVEEFSKKHFGKLLCMEHQRTEEKKQPVAEETVQEAAKEETIPVPRKYIIVLKGKEYITLPGLLNQAHQIGLESIETQMLSKPEDTKHLFKAIVTIRRSDNSIKTFVGHGDACVENTSLTVTQALIRMAETRSVARALRWATNIGMTAFEELGDQEAK